MMMIALQRDSSLYRWSCLLARLHLFHALEVSLPCICFDKIFKLQILLHFFQGSESLASWKANLLFEPVQFEVGSYLHVVIKFS